MKLKFLVQRKTNISTRNYYKSKAPTHFKIATSNTIVKSNNFYFTFYKTILFKNNNHSKNKIKNKIKINIFIHEYLAKQ